jgi:hypothetical protein
MASADDFDPMPAEKRGREREDEEGGQQKRRQVGTPVVSIPVRAKGPAMGVTEGRNQAPMGGGSSSGKAAAEQEKDVVMQDNVGDELEGDKAKRVPANTKWSNVKTLYAEEAKNLPAMILDSKLELPIGTLLALSNELTKTMTEDFR